MKKRIPIFDLVWCLSETVDLVSARAANHHVRTAYIAASIAEELGLPAENRARLVLAASMHDLGALSLKEAGGGANFGDSADDAHAETGYRLMRGFETLAEAAVLVKFHHAPRECAGDAGVRTDCAVLHLADCAARLAGRGRAGRPVLKATADFVPEQLEAFRSAAGRECFWLDLSSKSLRSILSAKVSSYSVQLDLDGVVQLGVFLSQIIDFRSHFTACHSSGVSACAEALAGLAGFSYAKRRLMRVAGYVHDLGKLAVPRSILQKAGPLSARETEIMRIHTYHTHRILGAIPALKLVREWGALHHERLDGSGYPFHYKADRLDAGSRLMAVADVFAALSEDRPYRRGLGRPETLSIMRGMARDRALDFGLVDLLEKNCAEIEHRRLLSQADSSGRYLSCLG